MIKPLQPAMNKESKQELKRDLEISLSVVDALIVRQEPIKAKERLLDLQMQYPGNPGVMERLHLLDSEATTEEDAEEIDPMPNREKIGRAHV